MEILYELYIKYPTEIKILEHKSADVFSPFSDGEVVKVDGFLSQNMIVTSMCNLPFHTPNFLIGTRGYYDYKGKYHDTIKDLSNCLDFKNELHFYSNKKVCLSVLSHFKKLIKNHENMAKEMLNVISDFEKQGNQNGV